MKSFEQWIAELREAGEKTTKAPWYLDHGNWEVESHNDSTYRDCICDITSDSRLGLNGEPNRIDAYDDAEFMVIARNEWDTLLDLLTRYREALGLYADPLSWRSRSGKIGVTPLTDGRDMEVIDGQPFAGGKKAREVLNLDPWNKK